MIRILSILMLLMLVVNTTISMAQEAITIEAGDNGIRLEENQVFVSEEFKRLLTDSIYRSEIYPDQYRLESVVSLLANQQEHLALWYLINLYDSQPLLTLQITKDLAEYTIHSEDFVKAFYSYAFSDPKVVQIKNGAYYIEHPERLDRSIKVTNLLASLLTRWKNS